MYLINDPYAREVFAYDFLEDRTVKGTFESPEYLTKVGAYRRKSLTHTDLFDNRPFINRETSKQEQARIRRLEQLYCSINGCKDIAELKKKRAESFKTEKCYVKRLSLTK